jgi:hypothetical protein
MSWLDCDTKNEQGKIVVICLKCVICTKYKEVLKTWRHFSNNCIDGAKTMKTSNIRDHASSNQHNHAMAAFNHRLYSKKALEMHYKTLLLRHVRLSLSTKRKKYWKLLLLSMLWARYFSASLEETEISAMAGRKKKNIGHLPKKYEAKIQSTGKYRRGRPRKQRLKSYQWKLTTRKVCHQRLLKPMMSIHHHHLIFYPAYVNHLFFYHLHPGQYSVLRVMSKYVSYRIVMIRLAQLLRGQG